MGSVWAATHIVTRHRVALKMVNPDAGSQYQDFKARFRQEARAAAAVAHPNVVRIHDLFEVEDRSPVIVMELLSGKTLRKRLSEEERLSLEEICSYLIPAISAVGTAHALGIVHRDVKPENIFLVETAGFAEPRVLDFGLAKLLTAQSRESPLDSRVESEITVGTPYYMSPEQGLGERDVDHRTDIWAFGIILFEALAGARPVEGANMAEVLQRLVSDAITPLEKLVSNLPPDIARLVGSMVSRNPQRRPEDLRPVMRLLERYTAARAPMFGPPLSESIDGVECLTHEAECEAMDGSLADTERAVLPLNAS